MTKEGLKYQIGQKRKAIIIFTSKRKRHEDRPKNTSFSCYISSLRICVTTISLHVQLFSVHEHTDADPVIVLVENKSKYSKQFCENTFQHEFFWNFLDASLHLQFIMHTLIQNLESYANYLSQKFCLNTVWLGKRNAKNVAVLLHLTLQFTVKAT